MSASCRLLVVVLSLASSLSADDQVKGQPANSFKPQFPAYYVNAAGDDVPKVDVHEQKELVSVDLPGSKVKEHPLGVVAADVGPTEIEVEKKEHETKDDIVPKGVEEENKDDLVPYIPDGTKDPEEKKKEEEEKPQKFPEDDMPKDNDYNPEMADPDEVAKMGPEIPMEPEDGSFMPTAEELPMDGFPSVPPKKDLVPDKEVTLYELCQRLGLGRFLFLMHRAGLRNILFRPGSFRFFAPTDEAFARLPFPMKVRLMRDPPFLRRVLLYHIMDARTPMPDKSYGYMKTKSPGMGVHINYYGGQMSVNGVPLTYPMHKSVNGEVYMIDNVIGPLPVGNLAQGLQSAGIFTRLYVLAVEAGILEKELSSPGPYTLFAPTDAAFQHLPKEVLEWLSWDNEALKDLLLKHIAKGAFYSSSIGMGKSEKIPTLGGSDVTMKRYAGEMTVNEIPVVRADLPATNGVMHAMDEVMFTSELQPRKRPPSLLAGRRRIYTTTT